MKQIDVLNWVCRNPRRSVSDLQKQDASHNYQRMRALYRYGMVESELIEMPKGHVHRIRLWSITESG